MHELGQLARILARGVGQATFRGPQPACREVVSGGPTQARSPGRLRRVQTVRMQCCDDLSVTRRHGRPFVKIEGGANSSLQFRKVHRENEFTLPYRVRYRSSKLRIRNSRIKEQHATKRFRSALKVVPSKSRSAVGEDLEQLKLNSHGSTDATKPKLRCFLSHLSSPSSAWTEAQLFQRRRTAVQDTLHAFDRGDPPAIAAQHSRERTR